MRLKNNISVTMNLTTMRLIKIGPNKKLYIKKYSRNEREREINIM